MTLETNIQNPAFKTQNHEMHFMQICILYIKRTKSVLYANNEEGREGIFVIKHKKYA